MSITSDEVNYLVYRYLQESGFVHSAFTFAYESLITKSSAANADVPPGALITFLQKGLQYVGIEEHLDEDGSEKACAEPFSLLSPHVCQVPTGHKSGKEKDKNRDKSDKDKTPKDLQNKIKSPVSSKRKSSEKGDVQDSSSSPLNCETNYACLVKTTGARMSGYIQYTSFACCYFYPAKKKANKVNMDIDPSTTEPSDNSNTKTENGEAEPSSSQKGGAPKAKATPEMEIPAELVTIFREHQSEVFMCAWNPRRDLLASGSGDSTARLWDLTGAGAGAGAPPRGAAAVLRHSDRVGDRNKDVTTLQWDRAGERLATGSYDGCARVWGPDGRLRWTLAAHTGPIFSLKWNKEGSHLLSGSYDKSAIVWDLNSSEAAEGGGGGDAAEIRGRVRQQFCFHTAPTLDVDWRDTRTFATCSTDRTIQYCALGEERPRRTFTGHTDEVNAIKWDAMGTLLASCSDDGTAKIWNPDKDSFVQNLCEHTKEIYTIQWSPTGPGTDNPNKPVHLASASFDATVKLWDVEYGKSIYTLSRNDESVYSVAFSPSGEYLASGSLAGHLCIWSVKDGALIKTYQGSGDIFEVAWNHSENKIAACYSTNVVTILDFRM
ncbi:unnamed protein product [Heterosigma akashiwo]